MPKSLFPIYAIKAYGLVIYVRREEDHWRQIEPSEKGWTDIGFVYYLGELNFKQIDIDEI